MSALAGRVYRRLGEASPCTRRARVALLIILVSAFALRVTWVVYAARRPVGFNDPGQYTLFGLRIAGGAGYTTLDGGPSAYYPIGYPAALAGIFWLMEHTPVPDDVHNAVGALNLVLGVATVWLTFELARRLFDNRTGLAAAAAMALFPNVIFHTAVAFTETLFTTLLMAALLILLAAPWDCACPRWPRLVAFGALLGLSALVRPISLLVLPVVAVVTVASGCGWRRALVRAGIATTATLAVIAPWTVRNLVVMDAPVLISTNVGDNLCMSRHEDASGGFQLDSPCFRGFEGLERPRYEIEHNDAGIEKAVEFVREHPLDEVRLWFWRSYHTLRHDHDGLDAVESGGSDRFISTEWRNVLRTTADAYFFASVGLAALAVPAFVGRRRPRRLLFLLAMASQAAAPVMFFGDTRFHFPVVPFLAIGSAAVVVRLGAAAREPGPAPALR